jgi:hypothetical protein
VVHLAWGADGVGIAWLNILVCELCGYCSRKASRRPRWADAVCGLPASDHGQSGSKLSRSGRDGKFLPAGICRVVERSFAWLIRYLRLNIIFERSKDYLIAFIQIAFMSILFRRLKRLVIEELGA